MTYEVTEDIYYQNFINSKTNITDLTRLNYKRALKKFTLSIDTTLETVVNNCKQQQDRIIEKKVIVDLDEIPTDSNVVSLTLEETCQRLNEQDQRIEELEKELEKEHLDDITMHERYRDNLLMDPTKCIHLKEFNKVISKDGRELSLYKCEKGHSLCQKSMFDPICEDYEIIIKSIQK